jgi:hypothetical protein
MRERPRAFQDNGLVWLVEIHIPVAADQKGEPHESRREPAHFTDAAKISFGKIQDIDKYPDGGDDAGDAKENVSHQNEFIHKRILVIVLICAPLAMQLSRPPANRDAQPPAKTVRGLK